LFRDQTLREKILQELLIRENIAPRKRHPWYRGGSDREFLRYIWQSYRRSVSDDYLAQLVQNYHTQYQRALGALPDLPWYEQTQVFLEQASGYGYKLGLKTDENTQELIDLLKHQVSWSFTIADYGDLLDPGATLVLESTLLGMQRAKAAGAWVLGVAQQMPYHWVQRHAHWAVDSLAEWDWERVTSISCERM
jgi:hypothetical protein